MSGCQPFGLRFGSDRWMLDCRPFERVTDELVIEAKAD
jgi:hypothetical protein